jgi:hypothetical protein
MIQKIIHIQCTGKYFADLMSRNPVGLNPEQCCQMYKSKDALVAAVNSSAGGTKVWIKNIRFFMSILVGNTLLYED